MAPKKKPKKESVKKKKISPRWKKVAIALGDALRTSDKRVADLMKLVEELQSEIKRLECPTPLSVNEESLIVVKYHPENPLKGLARKVTLVVTKIKSLVIGILKNLRLK